MESAARMDVAGNIPISMQDLKEIIEGYTAPRFEAVHGYRFTDDPPTSIRAMSGHVADTFVERASNFLYIGEQDSGPGLSDYIQDQVFNEIRSVVLTNDIRDKMISDVLQQYTAITQDARNTWSWKTTPFDKRYGEFERVQNKFRQTGVLLSRRAERVTDNGVKLVVIYIHVMMVVYQELNPRMRLHIALINKLSDREPGTKLPDYTGVVEAMRHYAERRWNDVFGFQFQDAKTELPDGIQGSRGAARVTFAKAILIPEYPVSTHTVETWMNAELFGRQSQRFPSAVASEIYDYVRDHILSSSSAGKAERDKNSWQEVNRITEFTANSMSTTIKYYGMFVYAWGEISDDEIPNGNDDSQKTTIQQLYGYHVMAFGAMRK